MLVQERPEAVQLLADLVEDLLGNMDAFFLADIVKPIPKTTIWLLGGKSSL